MTPTELEILKEFQDQCREDLESLDVDLVALEKDPSSSAILARIFRVMHNLKGASGYLEFSKMERLAHEAESLLDLLRRGQMQAEKHIISVLLRLADAFRQYSQHINQSGSEGDHDFPELLEQVQNIIKANNRPASEASTEETYILEKVSETENVEYARPMAGQSSIRVDVKVLDDLMNMVGELVLVRNQILQSSNVNEDCLNKSTSQRLNLVTAELQEQVMRTRMHPIRSIFSRLPRVIRDVSVACNLDVGLEMEGHDTELDKSIIEAVHDPLVHLVRNAVAHGIESPAERLKNNKPAKGTVKLRAYHEGGHVIVEISDDGRGIDAEAIRRRATDLGLITAARAAQLDERESLRLICLPGFSTNTEVNNISGRGVGMDVVRSNMESIGGKIDITSELGQGTTFKIKIPLTLAIIPGLIVVTQQTRFIIPQTSLLELVRLEGNQARQRLESIQGRSVLRLRGSLLPLGYLSEILELSPNKKSDPTTLDDESVINIVVLEADGHSFGIVVDSIVDTEEIVVKPLGEEIRQIPVFAGATIMGDGNVALILDVVGLAQQGRLLQRLDEIRPQNQDADDLEQRAGTVEHVLSARLDPRRRIAIPLQHIARLEKLQPHQVEWAGDQPVVQYRDGLLPLIDLRFLLHRDSISNTSALDGDQTWSVVVCRDEGGSVGIIVEEILDICSERVEIQIDQFSEFVVGTMVLQGRVTQMIDVASVLQSARRDHHSTVLVGV